MWAWLKRHFANLFKRRHPPTQLARNPSDQLTFTGHLTTELRPGPHSTETVTHSRSISVDAFVVHMPQEMYKDALFFFREARSNHSNTDSDPFITWRNLRATILFSFAAIESCINQFIDDYIDTNKGALPQKDADYWTEKSGFVSINKKLNEGVVLFGGTRLDADAALWQQYTDLKDLRDDLVHYKVANRLFYNTDELLQRAEKSILTASAVVKKIYLAHPANTAYPNTFDEVP
jgi:hypothetical protein